MHLNTYAREFEETDRWLRLTGHKNYWRRKLGEQSTDQAGEHIACATRSETWVPARTDPTAMAVRHDGACTLEDDDAPEPLCEFPGCRFAL